MAALYNITRAYYELLTKHAKQNEDGELVYEGSVTDLYKQAGGSTRYYSMVRQLLLSPVGDPCIEIRRQGNSYQTSIIVLKHGPLEEWEEMRPGDLTMPALPDRVVGVETRLAALELWRETTFREVNIREVLRDFERRLSQLEGETG